MTTYAHNTLVREVVDAAEAWTAATVFPDTHLVSKLIPAGLTATTADGKSPVAGETWNLRNNTGAPITSEATFDDTEIAKWSYVGHTTNEANVGAVQEFDDLSLVDSATFAHGERILVREAEFGGPQYWVFNERANEGGHEISDVSSGYLDLLGDRLFEWPLVSDGGVQPNPLNFRSASIGFGGLGDTDRPYGYEQFHIRRHTDSTMPLPTDLVYDGQPWTIAADDFGTWLVERRGDDAYTVIGKLGSKADPTTTNVLNVSVPLAGSGYGASNTSWTRDVGTLAIPTDGLWALTAQITQDMALSQNGDSASTGGRIQILDGTTIIESVELGHPSFGFGDDNRINEQVPFTAVFAPRQMAAGSYTIRFISPDPLNIGGARHPTRMQGALHALGFVGEVEAGSSTAHDTEQDPAAFAMVVYRNHPTRPDGLYWSDGTNWIAA